MIVMIGDIPAIFLGAFTAAPRRRAAWFRVGWLLLGGGLVFGLGCGRASKPEARPNQMPEQKIYRVDRPTGNISARLDRFIPPEVTDYPMPGGLSRYPDVPQRVIDSFRTVATRPGAAQQGRRDASRGGAHWTRDANAWNMHKTHQLLARLAIVARKTLTASPGTELVEKDMPAPAVRARESAAESSQWGGSSYRNNVSSATDIPTQWNVGKFDLKTGKWIPDGAEHVRWAARLGNQTYGSPVAADGRVFVATNNGAGYLKRYPKSVDLGCLLCFRQSDGAFLWQYSSEKLASGAQNDWPEQGICCGPLVEGDRLWCVTNRGEVVCLDTQGFRDNQDDGPDKCKQPGVAGDVHEADTVWRLDMMKQLHIFQHNMCSCSVTALGDILFVNTSNGVDESHEKIPAPDAPSFIALNKRTGAVLWTDRSPGHNILHGQWSSPAAGLLGGVPQVIFAGGDGWVYSFRADEGTDGKPALLWKFDVNPKTWKWSSGGSGERNNIIGTPVIHDGLVYVASGQDPEYGEGPAYLWCIDPTRRGDVSPWLAVKANDHADVLPPRRVQAVIPEQGEEAIDNPNSAAVWGYHQNDADGNGEIDFKEEMHRSIGMVVIQDGLLFAADFSGLLHCLDAKTGKVHWTYDLLAPVWGSPLIVDGHLYVADEEGDVRVFNLSAKAHEPIAEVNMGDSVYTTPAVAGKTLFISTRSYLFAIQTKSRAGKE